MLRAAFRNKQSKGAENYHSPDQRSQDSGSEDDEFHEFAMEFSKNNEMLDEAEMKMDDKTDKEAEKFSSEDSNANSLSQSKRSSQDQDASKLKERNFPYTEREIYEMQLIQLQEQLVATMIAEQEKSEQLKKYKEIDIEVLQNNLKEEQEKNADLTEKVKVLKNKLQNSKLSRTNANKSDPRKKSNRSSQNLESDYQGDEWIDVSVEMGMEGNSQAQERSDQPDVPSSPSDSSSHCPDIKLSTEPSAPELARKQSVKDKPDGTSESTPRRLKVQNYYKKATEMIVDRLWDFVNEEQESTPEDKEDGDTLSVKKLKENINRFFFLTMSKEIKRQIGLLQQLVTWYKIRHAGWQRNVKTFRTKRLQPVNLDFSLFLMSQCAVSHPARRLLYHVTSCCKRPIVEFMAKWWNNVTIIAKNRSNGIKPITNSVKSVYKLTRWYNIAASTLAFIIYMYAARYGYLFSLLLLVVIWKLFMNYLSARGIAAQIGLETKEKEEVTEDKSLSDKFQLVLEVAKKVQNTLGEMADSLEKIKNLLMWQHPATKKLFINLCLLFLASLLLSGPTLFMFMALGLGLKLFVTAPIYHKFPKVKKRYDGVAVIWTELPTDAGLADVLAAERQGNVMIMSNGSTTTGQSSTDASTSRGSHQSVSHHPSQNLMNFCEKLKIPLSERPLPFWEEGHRCTLLNKDKPLTNMKHGRLYLTQNYLCFERTSRSGSSKNIAIKLENITSVSKYKPIHIMPGTGMSIEVEVKGINKPYIFGALLGRDELFESLLMTGRAANYRWASKT